MGLFSTSKPLPALLPSACPHQPRLVGATKEPDVFRLEGVVVCSHYSDFLAVSLPLNKPHFDYLAVVSSPDDLETRRVCEHWNVHCLLEPRLNVEGGGFRKGAGINAGFGVLKKDSWFVHLDADIVLPPRYREFIQQADLDTNYVYGCDRLMVPNFEAWHEFTIKPQPQYECNAFVHPRPFPVGVRFASPSYAGWVPLGFHQLMHRDSGQFLYSEEHTTAGRGDLLWSAQWPRNRRGFIPEIFVYHLESESVPMGSNWNGRQTRIFGPESKTVLTDAAIKKELLENDALMHAAIRS